MSDETSNDLYKALFALLSIPLLIVLRGHVLVDLWDWFIVPFGVESIGVAHAIGVSVLIAYVTSRYTYYDYKRAGGDMGVEPLLFPYGSMLFTWLLGSVVHSFMVG